MGDLIRASNTVLQAAIQIFDRFGVLPRHFERLPKLKWEEQEQIARVLQFDPTLLALLDMESLAREVGFELSDFYHLANNKKIMAEVWALIRKNTGDPAENMLVRVKRSIGPGYPSWVDSALHADLAKTGPAEYKLSELDLWYHDRQKDGGHIGGFKLHAYLVEYDIVKSCLTLSDGVEIRKKGLAIYRLFFKGKRLFLWKSAVKGPHYSSVPCVRELDDKLVIEWRSLEGDFTGDDPAVHFME